MNSFIHQLCVNFSDLRMCVWTLREFLFSISGFILLLTPIENNDQKKLCTLSFSFIVNIKASVNFLFYFLKLCGYIIMIIEYHINN